MSVLRKMLCVKELQSVCFVNHMKNKQPWIKLLFYAFSWLRYLTSPGLS